MKTLKILLTSLFFSGVLFLGGKGVRILKFQKPSIAREIPKDNMTIQNAKAVLSNEVPTGEELGKPLEERIVKPVELVKVKEEKAQTPSGPLKTLPLKVVLKNTARVTPPQKIKYSKKMRTFSPKDKGSKGKKVFKWERTEFQGTEFDLSDKLYAHITGEEDLTIQFEKMDHQKLLAEAMEALKGLDDSLEKREPAASAPRMAAQPPKKSPDTASDRVDNLHRFVGKMGKISKKLDIQRKSQGVSSPRAALQKEDQVTEKTAGTIEAKPRGEEPQSTPFVPSTTRTALTPGEPSVPIKNRQISYNPFVPDSYGDKGPLLAAVDSLLTDSPPRVRIGTTAKKKTSQNDEKPKEAPEKQVDSHSSSPKSPVKTLSHKFLSAVSPQVFSLNRGPVKHFKNYELRPDYSSGERLSDGGTGIVEVSGDMSGALGIMGVSLLGGGIMQTRFDLTLEKGTERSTSVPVFEQGEFESLFEKEGFSGGGGLLFVELSDSTESVNVDGAYEGLLYFNREMRSVGQSDDYHYLLFVGVEPGSTTIEYIRNGYENLKRVVLIERGVVYYDSNEYLEVGDDVVEINKKSVLGSQEADLNISEKDIVQFNSYEKVTQLGSGRYNFGVNVLPSGTRKYVELNHLSSPIYLGRWDAKKVTLPSEQYISSLLDALDLDDLSGTCLIQINFRENVRELSVEGKNGEEYISVDKIYMDSEGNLSRSISALVTKGFLLLDQTGVISARVNYTNHRSDYFSTYCSPSVYIIEQL